MNGMSIIIVFFLIIVNPILAVIFAGIWGEFKFGSLKKTIKFDLEADNAAAAAFDEMFENRLKELRFVESPESSPNERVFTQSVGTCGVTATHATTSKKLVMRASYSSLGRGSRSLSLKYTDLILVDTGASVYRDSVLDYLSGCVDAMRIVPTLSFFAACCFSGGIFAVALLLVEFAFHLGIPSESVLLFCMVSLFYGALGLFEIIVKPKEITGLYRIFCGVVINAAVILFILHSS